MEAVNWDRYTEENLDNYYKDIGRFIWYNCLGLGCTNILDVGCNVGMELVGFSDEANLTGVDTNIPALEIARKTHPTFVFTRADVLYGLPFGDNSFDMVFDRGLLIHIPNSHLNIAMKEMLRVSKKYVMNIEYFGEDGEKIAWRKGEQLYYRNMKKNWRYYPVKVISDIEIPLKIDENRVHYTLVKK